MTYSSRFIFWKLGSNYWISKLKFRYERPLGLVFYLFIYLFLLFFLINRFIYYFGYFFDYSNVLNIKYFIHVAVQFQSV